MNKKITLNLNKEIIRQAKIHAKEHNISLSSLIETYLQKILLEHKYNKGTKRGIVEELSGIISLDSEEDAEEYIKAKFM